MHIHIDTVAEHRAIVDPYPFAVDPLVFSFPARLVPNRRYDDPDDFFERVLPRRAHHRHPHPLFELSD